MKYALICEFKESKLRYECDSEIELFLAIDFFMDCLSFAKEIYFYEFDDDNNIIAYQRFLKNEDWYV